MAFWRRALCVLLLSATAFACSPFVGGGTPTYDEVSETELYDIDFIGILLEAEPARWGNSRELGFTSGGPDSRMPVGPGTLRFTNGTSVNVPADTPGGNICRDLGGDGGGDGACIVFGELDNAGDVEWFEVSISGSPRPTDQVVDLYSFSWVEGWHEDLLVVAPGIALPVTDDLRFADCEASDGDPRPGTLTAPERALGLVANINHEGAVETLFCVRQ